MSRKRIGELLVERRAITQEQLDAGLVAQKRTKQRLGATLIQQGAISEVQLAIVLAQSLELGSVDLSKAAVDWSAVHMLRARFCENHEVFPFGIEGKGTPNKKLLLAMADPLNQSALEEVEFTTGLKVSVRVATHSHVREAILRYYHKVTSPDVLSSAAAVGPKGAMPIGVGTSTMKLVPADVREEPSGEVLVGEEIVSQLNRMPSPVPMPLPVAPAPPQAPAPQTDGTLEKLISEHELKSRSTKKRTSSEVAKDLEFLFGAQAEDESVERLERKFWVLMRIMARKGLITREEFLKELEEEGGDPGDGGA